MAKMRGSLAHCVNKSAMLRIMSRERVQRLRAVEGEVGDAVLVSTTSSPLAKDSCMGAKSMFGAAFGTFCLNRRTIA